MAALGSLLEVPALVCGGVAAGCWALSVATREYSWVDRLWSLVPCVYLWLFAWGGGWQPRSVLMALLVSAWGARLTFNFARKGGYAPGGEDYRWGELRKRMPPWAFQLFNVGFIAGYQNLLLLLICLPAWSVASRPGAPLGLLDAMLSLAFLLFLAGETVADQQQWEFHQRKKALLEKGEEVREPFLTTGLFAWSRHPNFFCEQAQWWVLTLFPVAAGERWLTVASLGAALLTLLFHGSANFTESLTLRKYPSYAEYQRRVPRMLPRP